MDLGNPGELASVGVSFIIWGIATNKLWVTVNNNEDRNSP
jgi:hypothetical protein